MRFYSWACVDMTLCSDTSVCEHAYTENAYLVILGKVIVYHIYR